VVDIQIDSDEAGSMSMTPGFADPKVRLKGKKKSALEGPPYRPFLRHLFAKMKAHSGTSRRGKLSSFLPLHMVEITDGS